MHLPAIFFAHPVSEPIFVRRMIETLSSVLPPSIMMYSSGSITLLQHGQDRLFEKPVLVE